MVEKRNKKTKEEKIEQEEPQWGATNCDENGEVRVVGNHIYFYAPIDTKPVASLIDGLHTLANKQRTHAIENGGDPQPIILHISSGGGSVSAGIASMDAVRLCSVPIYTIIDGMCASAATLPFVVATKRTMSTNSYMLIHQLSSAHWGNFTQLQDSMENSTEFMRLIKKIYLKHTKIPRKKLDKILKHDLWFNAGKCLKFGMVDEII